MLRVDHTLFGPVVCYYPDDHFTFYGPPCQDSEVATGVAREENNISILSYTVFVDVSNVVANTEHVMTTPKNSETHL